MGITLRNGVDEMGIETVDEIGIDEMGSNPARYTYYTDLETLLARENICRSMRKRKL